MAKSAEGNARGQAVVELALVVPVVVLFAMLVLQIGLVMRDQIALIHGCGAAARAASISPDPDTTAADVVGGIAAISTATVATGTADGLITVTAKLTSITDLPIIGFLVPDVDLTASATYEIQN